MKLGVTGLRGLPGVMGGIESHCEHLYGLVKQALPNCEIIITARRGYVPEDRTEFHGMAIAVLPAIRNRYFEAVLHTFLAILHLRFRRNVDSIHIHGIGPALMAPLSRLLGMRVIVTHHGQDYNRAKWNGFAKWVLQMGELCAILSAHDVIVVSEFMTRALKARFPRRAYKIHHIPNGGFASSTGRPDPAQVERDLEQLGLKKNEYTLSVGRLVPEKGFHELVEAFQASGRPGKLVIAGSADHADRYAKELLARADDRIVFLGFCSRTVLQSLYSATSLFVLASHHEGLPISVLEAASMGAPVLLSDIEPHLEFGLPTRHYFETGNVSSLADCLSREQVCYRIDDTHVLDSYDWTNVARATANIYKLNLCPQKAAVCAVGVQEGTTPQKN